MARRIEFEFEDMEDGTTKCSAKGTAFKWGDLMAISSFALDLMEIYNMQDALCYKVKFDMKQEGK